MLVNEKIIARVVRKSHLRSRSNRSRKCGTIIRLVQKTGIEIESALENVNVKQQTNCVRKDLLHVMENLKLQMR